MPIDLSAIDLGTLNAAQGVIVAAIRNQCFPGLIQSLNPGRVPAGAAPLPAAP